MKNRVAKHFVKHKNIYTVLFIIDWSDNFVGTKTNVTIRHSVLWADLTLYDIAFRCYPMM